MLLEFPTDGVMKLLDLNIAKTCGGCSKALEVLFLHLLYLVMIGIVQVDVICFFLEDVEVEPMCTRVGERGVQLLGEILPHLRKQSSGVQLILFDVVMGLVGPLA